MSDAPLPARKRRAPDPGTRTRILEVARDIITESGLEGLKARIVAKAAGTSVGTLYNTFGPIEELARLINAETYDALHAHQSEALAAARERGASPREQLHALASAYFAWVEDHRRQWLATMEFNRSGRGEPPPWYTDRETALLGIVADAVSGFGGRRAPDELHRIAYALWASIHGIVSMSLGREGWRLPESEITARTGFVVDACATALENGSRTATG